MACRHLSLWKLNRIHVRIHLLYCEPDHICSQCSFRYYATESLQMVVHATLLCHFVSSGYGPEDFNFCKVSCFWWRNDFHNLVCNCNFCKHFSKQQRLAWQQSINSLVQQKSLARLNRICHLRFWRNRCHSPSLGYHRRQRRLLQDNMYNLWIHYPNVRQFFRVLLICLFR